MTILTVSHETTYRYARPVVFGEHRMMLRPRDSHDMRIIGTSLTTTPGATVRWLHDMFGNSVAAVTFSAPADTLRVVSRFTIEHYPQSMDFLARGPRTDTWPVAYSPEEMEHLSIDTAPRYPDQVTARFASRFVGAGDGTPLDYLAALARGIQGGLRYQARHALGTQLPAETLLTRQGTCRDFALLMMEAARSQGFAARFVTGYLYDPAMDGGGVVMGAGATHAWAQIYLPEAGWVEFDPTNGIIGGANLVRVAAVRDPGQATPVAGTWYGGANDFLGMDVAVSVTMAPSADYAPSNGDGYRAGTYGS